MQLISPFNALSSAVTKLVARIESEDVVQDQVVFAGNWHDAVPRLLIHDPALMPLDLAVWMVLKAYCSPAAPAAFVGGLYHTLMTHTKCNRATVSAALTRMRLLRWISVCAVVRRNNRFRGQVYALHDQPICLADACRLDASYMTFVHGALQHRNSRIAVLAQALLESLNQSIHAGVETFESDALDRAGQRVGVYQTALPGEERASSQVQPPVDEPALEPFFAVNRRIHEKVIRSANSPSSNSELGEIQISDRNLIAAHHGPSLDARLNTRSSSCSSFEFRKTKETTTTTDISADTPESERQSAAADVHPVAMAHDGPSSLEMPEELDANEQQLAIRYLRRVTPEHQQPLLDELAGRIRAGRIHGDPVRNPIAYLNRLINLCVAGQIYQSSLSARVARERQTKRLQRRSESSTTSSIAGTPSPEPIELSQRVAEVKRALRGKPLKL